MQFQMMVKNRRFGSDKLFKGSGATPQVRGKAR